MPDDKPDLPMTFFLFAYWHDARWEQFVGASVKIWDLANNLHHMGHEVVLFLPKYGFKKLNASFKIVEIPVINLPGLRMLSFNFFLSVYLLFGLIKIRPEVVYLRRTTAIVPMLYAKRIGALFFFEVNDDPYYGTAAAGVGRFLSRLRNVLSVRLDEMNLRSSDRAFVISPEIIRKILKKNPSLHPRKFTWMPSGANVELFVPIEKDVALATVKLDASKRYVGFVGTLLAHQGVDVLIDAAASILAKQPDCRFLVIGEGPMKEEWRDRARRLGLIEAFVFTGQIPYDELPAWINAMDVCVAPYSLDSGYRSPVKVFDYLACGRPVVASRIAGTTDIFYGIDAVRLVEPEAPEKLAGAILSLLRDPAYCEQVGPSGREWVKTKYSRAAMAQKVADAATVLMARRTRHKKG